MATLFSFPWSTGVIYTAGILDCESKDAYWLTVYATDRGVTPLSASVEVFIQVPTLQHTHISLNMHRSIRLCGKEMLSRSIMLTRVKVINHPCKLHL